MICLCQSTPPNHTIVPTHVQMAQVFVPSRACQDKVKATAKVRQGESTATNIPSVNNITIRCDSSTGQ